MRFKSEVISRHLNEPTFYDVSTLQKKLELEEDVSLLLSVQKLLTVLQDIKGHFLLHDHNPISCSDSDASATMSVVSQSQLPQPRDVKCHLEMLSVLRDEYVWEKLNVGHWKTVSLGWRRFHYFFTFLKVIFMLYSGSSLREMIRECDLGILMGEPVIDNVLHTLSEELSQAIIQSSENFNDNQDHHEDEGHHFESLQDKNGVALRLQSNSRFEVTRSKNPDLEYFMKTMNRCEPLLITQSIEHWPARRKWNIEHIKKVAGFRTVPVEIGSKYTSEDWTQKLMTLDEFIDEYMTVQIQHKTKFTEKDKPVGYVAQHQLFEQIFELKKDIRVPDFCSLGKNDLVDINAWFGPSNTVSPTHFDPKHNILVQVFGTKIIRLYPPSESVLLKPYPETSILFNTSQLDLDTLTFEEYPELKNAKYCEFLLQSGDAVYIPPKWWHYVRSLTPCFSISFWFE